MNERLNSVKNQRFSDIEGSIYEKSVLLQDGREMIFRPEDIKITDADKYKDYYIKLAWIDLEIPLHSSLFTILTNLFSTHSLSYAEMACRAFYIWNNSISLSHKITLEELQSIALIKPSFHPFIFPQLRRINDANIVGLDDEVKNWLIDGYKFEETGNGQYLSLITNDPEQGALTDQELHNLHGALNMAYESGVLNQHDYTLSWMFIGTGLRPSQIARMKVSDILINNGPEGKEVTLRVGLSKGEKTSQTEYWLRRAPSVLAECLLTYLDNSDLESLDYLFLNGNKNRNIAILIRDIFKGLKTWSDRLEGPIPITSYRFRYTLATRALRQGASDYEVARLLTHRSTSCIQFYRASMPELQKPIQTAIGAEMDYFARAFQGKLIRSLDEATYPDEGEQQILDFMHVTGQTLGACGTHEECHLNAPVSCLSCHRFEPLEDAPWEELLNSLKEDQAVENEERIQMLNMNAMSSIVEIIAERDKRIEARK